MEHLIYSDEWALAAHAADARTYVSEGLRLHDDVEAAKLKGDNHATFSCDTGSRR